MRVDVLRRIRSTPDPVLLLDIDSTLIDTGARHLSILRAYALQAGDEALQAFAEGLTPSDFSWTVDGPLGDSWASHVEPLRAFWWQAFFSPDHLCDEAVPGALEFARKAHRAGAWLYYLTARPLESMGVGTAQQLIELGFPVFEGRSTLHLKPSRSISDNAFKEDAMRSVAQAGTVVATYENEPANANLFARSFPDALHYLLDTVHSPGAPPLDDGVVKIPDFAR